MNNNKTHAIDEHFVPKCYLRIFTYEKNKVFIYRNGALSTGNIKKLCNERYIYEILDEDKTIINLNGIENELGMAAVLAVEMFYQYGGIYGIFSGHPVDNIVVEFYNPDGELIQTANSADAGF